MLDFDVKTGGLDSLKRLEAEHGAILTTRVRTQGGGMHLVFRHDLHRPLPTRAGVLNHIGFSGVDARGPGGYVVVPPSRTAQGAYAVIDGRVPIHCPEWLYALILTPFPSPMAPSKLPVDDGTRISRHALERALAETESGRGDDVGLKLACQLRDNGIFDAEALRTLADYADRATTDSTHPFTAHDVQRWWRSANARPPREPWPAPDSAGHNAESCIHKGNSGVMSHPPLIWKPFPVDLLGESLAAWVYRRAEAIPCDPAMMAPPLLAALASSIGATRRIALKRGWVEPAVLWAAIIAPSGGAKSPALDAALWPVREIERAAMRRFREDQARFKKELVEYEKTPKKDREGEPPRRPACERVIVSDTTIEALAPLLGSNSRGLLLFRDEIAGWLDGMGQYKSGKGDDQAKWLEIHGARSLRIDRKTGDDRFIYVPRAAVSVVGGIQPGILRRCVGQTERENGLLARLLLAWPPEIPKRWTNIDANAELDGAVLGIFKRLRGLDFEPSKDGDPEPVDLYLEPGANRVWGDFVNRHGEQIVEIANEDLRAAWAKLEGATARLALILHLATWAASGRPTPGPVEQDALERAIGLTDWFKHEIERVYQALEDDQAGQKARRIFEAVHRLGDRATPRELMRAMRREYQGEGAAERAEIDLRALVKAGLGNWVEREQGPQGGRPTFELVLNGVTGHNPEIAE